MPARWAGTALRVSLKDSCLEFYHENLGVSQMDRHTGDRGGFVNWRHVLPQLRRKPGAFARWRHRQRRFPSRLWREFYVALRARHLDGRTEREYLGVLTLALEKTLSEVEEAPGSLGSARAELDAMRLQLHAQNRAWRSIIARTRKPMTGCSKPSARTWPMPMHETTELLLHNLGLGLCARELAADEAHALQEGWSVRPTLRELFK